MNLSASINRAMQKLLYLWVRSNSVPDEQRQLGIDPDKPVVYVMYQRSWSNLLVFAHEAKRLGLPSPFHRIDTPALNRFHSVYTIAPREPFKAWLLNEPKRSELIDALLDHMDSADDHDIQLVPVTLFWGRLVTRQRHWLTLLFADSWQIASRTRKFFTILFHGRHALVTLSRPVSLRSLCTGLSDRDQRSDAVHSALKERLVEMRMATLGPDLSHRNTMIRDIISTELVQDEIRLRADDRNISQYKASLYARKYLREIVADCSNITIQFMQRLLSHFWNRFYSGIDLHNHHQLHELAITHELVYVPCHRSHVDYLLLSYLIHNDKLAIPYIAAGNNLNMPLLGRLLRSGGAFFIRRSFKGNTLYTAALFEYIATLMSRGMSLEYFVEGGRSRTGRLLKPKLGILSMTVRAYLKYRQKPVAFLPVYIGYEKLIESKSYLAELSGEDKKSETLIGSIASILKLHGRFGRVNVTFADPILLDDILDRENERWREQSLGSDERPEWLQHAVAHVSHRIMRGINEACSVNSTSMIATILLCTPNRTMDEKELVQMMLLYSKLIENTAYSPLISLSEQDPMHQIRHLEGLKLVRRRSHALGDIIYLDTKQSTALTYYRNNVLHLFAMPSLVACCFINMRSQTREQVINLISMIFPFIKHELFLHYRRADMADVTTATLNALADLGLLIRNEQLDMYTRPGSGAFEYTQLNMLAEILSPVLEVYYMTLALLATHTDDPIPREQLEQRSVLLAQRVSMMSDSASPDYFDRKLIANFIDALLEQDFLDQRGTASIAIGEAFHTADKHARLLLSRTTRTNILQMVKLNPVSD